MVLAMEWPSAVDGVEIGFRASGAFERAGVTTLMPSRACDLVGVILSSLCARGLANAAGVNSVWRLAASPLIDAIAVDLVDDVVSNMMEYEPIQGAPGECIGCGAVAAAFSQCLSCGAPVEPNDNSWHYSFGWVEGPRPE